MTDIDLPALDREPEFHTNLLERIENTEPMTALVGAADPSRRYVGLTNDIHERLAWHNAGPCGHTLRYRPWRMIVSIELPDEPTAARFGKYLKSGSGRAFAKRHFCP